MHLSVNSRWVINAIKSGPESGLSPSLSETCPIVKIWSTISKHGWLQSCGCVYPHVFAWPNPASNPKPWNLHTLPNTQLCSLIYIVVYCAGLATEWDPYFRWNKIIYLHTSTHKYMSVCNGGVSGCSVAQSLLANSKRITLRHQILCASL